MIRALLRSGLGDIRHHRLQTALVLCVLTAATGTLALAVVLGRGAVDPWDRAFERTNGAHVLVAAPSVEEAGGVLEMAGIADADGPIPYLFAPGVFGGGPDLAVRLYGPADPPRVAAPDLVAGRWLEADDEIVLERVLANDLGVSVGDRVDLPVAEGTSSVEVVGLALISHRGWYDGDAAGSAYLTPRTLGTVHLPGAEPFELYALRLDDPNSAEGFVSRVHDTAGSVFAVDWQELRRILEWQNLVNSLVLGVFGVFAMVAVALIVANTVSARIASRAREIGILKAVGLRPLQVGGMLIVQYVLTALIGSATGLAAAVALAPQLLGATTRALATPRELLLDPVVLVVVLAAVLGIVVAASAVPAWQAGRLPAVQAIRGPQTATDQRSRIAGAAARMRLPFVVAIGLKDVFARRLRVVRTVAALVLTVLTGVFALGLHATVQSVRADPAVVGWPGDVFVWPGEVEADEAARLIAEDPRVVSSFAATRFNGLLDGDPRPVLISAITGADARTGFDVRAGRLVQGPGEAMVGYGLWEDEGLGSHDQLVLTAQLDDAAGVPTSITLELDVVGHYSDWQGYGRIATVDAASLPERLGDLPVTFYGLRLVDAAEQASVADALASASGGRLETATAEEIAVPTEIGTFRTVTLALAGVLAVVGLTNLLLVTLLGVHEQSRELGVLKSLGLTPRQVVAAVTSGTALLALMATLIGAPAGVMMQRWLFDLMVRRVGVAETFGVSPHAGQLALLFPTAVVLAVLAAALPAWRAGRIPVAEALRTE